MRLLCVNVVIVVEELWEGFETAKCLPWVGLLGLLYAASSARGVWKVSIIFTYKIYINIESSFSPLSD